MEKGRRSAWLRSGTDESALCEWLPWGAVVLLVVVLASFAAAGTAAQSAQKAGPVKAISASEAESELGIKVEALRLTEAGNLLDFRYRVLDPEKAHACLSRNVKPYIEEPSTGLRLSVPTMPTIGALRQTAVAPEKGKVYFILFGNAGTAVKAGSKVNVVFGGLTIENLTVE